MTPTLSSAAALKAVLNIFEIWGTTDSEQQRMLGIDDVAFFELLAGPDQASLGDDTLERLSVILNIHAALRTLFSTPESVSGWVRKPNNHPFFAGRCALDVMCQGRVADLHDVLERLNSELG